MSTDQLSPPLGRSLAPVGAPGALARLASLLVSLSPLVQAVIAILGAAAAIALLVAGPVGAPLPVFLLLLAVPVGVAVTSGLAAVRLVQRRSSGRVLAIAVDYLVLFGLLVAFGHVSGLYLGLDAVADTFPGAVPWLGLGLLAFLLGYALDAVTRRPSVERVVRLARNGVVAVAALGFLATLGAPRAVVDLALGLADPGRAALALAATVLLAVLLALWGHAGRTRYGASLRDGELLNGIVLVSPNLLGFLGFFAGPLLFSLYVSLADWDAFSAPVVVGLRNYLDILSLQVLVGVDPAVALPPGLEAGFSEILRVGSVVIAAKDKLFWISLRNILVFSVIAIPLAVAPALFIASLLNSKVRGVRFFRAIYFIPSVAGVVGVAIIWKQLLDQSVGWVNYFISAIVDGLNGAFGLGITDPQIGWLSDPATALPAIAIVFAWTQVGFNAILFVAGLQGIPADLYEAAEIDGANRWQRFRNVTLPMVAPTTFFVVATTTILALQLFTEPYVLTSPNPGGPNNATLTPVMYLYNVGYQQFEFGYASAVAWVLFALIFAFTLVQYRRQRRDAAAFGG